MTILALVLLATVALAPLAALPARRVPVDPVLPVAGLCVALLAVAALTAAAADETTSGWLRGAAVVAGVATATSAGSPVVRGVFRVVRKELLPRRTSGVAAPPGRTGEPVEEALDRPENVLRGGAWIGYLERAAVASTLLAGWPEGIALVLAVKGVGRYAELRETNAPEAFIIGTLASLLWAAAAAGTAHLLTG